MGTQSWATWVASKWNHKHQRRKCDGGTEVRWGVGGWEDAARPAMRMGEVPRASGQFPEPREGQETDTRSEPPGGTSPSDTLIPARGWARTPDSGTIDNTSLGLKPMSLVLLQQQQEMIPLLLDQPHHRPEGMHTSNLTCS